MVRRGRSVLVATIVALASLAVAPPASAATVHVTGTVTQGGVPLQGAFVDLTGNGAAVRTAADGTYAMDVEANATAFLTVEWDGTSTFNADGRVTSQVDVLADAQFDVQLPAAATHTVHVFDANGPVANAQVTSRQTAFVGVVMPGTITWARHELDGTTGTDGTVTFRQVVSPADVGVVAQRHHNNGIYRSSSHLGVDVTDGSTLEVELPPIVTVGGTVTDTDGAPLRDVAVRVGQGNTTTGVTGTWTAPILAGEQELRVSMGDTNRPAGFPELSASSTVDLVGGEQLDVELPLATSDVNLAAVDTRGDSVGRTLFIVAQPEVNEPASMPGAVDPMFARRSAYMNQGTESFRMYTGPAIVRVVNFFPGDPRSRSREVELTDVPITAGANDLEIELPAVATAPTSATVEPGDGTIDVAWDVEADPGDAPTTGYDVVVRPPGAPNDPVRYLQLPADARSTQVTGLQNGRTYEVLVRAVNSVGPGTSATLTTTPRKVHLVDLRARARPRDAWVGDDLYARLGQSVLTLLPRGGSATYRVSVQNDGLTTERMVLDDVSSAPGVTIRYLAGGRDVTGAVRRGTYRTPVLAYGQTHVLDVRVRVSPTASVRRGRTVAVRAHPAGRATPADKVSFALTVL